MDGETAAAVIPAAAAAAAGWSSAGAAVIRGQRCPGESAAAVWIPGEMIPAAETWADRQNAANVRKRDAAAAVRKRDAAMAAAAVRKIIMIMAAAAAWREKIPATVPA